MRSGRRETDYLTLKMRSDVLSSVKVVLISTIIIALILGLLDLVFVTGMNLIF